jgi:hypothetical protein
VALEDFFAHKIFSKLDENLEEEQFFRRNYSFTVRYLPAMLNVTFTIQSQKQFDYAKSLVRINKVYRKEYGMFKAYNESMFDRFFSLEGPFNGKTSYELDEHQVVGHHRLYGHFRDYESIVPYYQGFTSHFRKQLNINIYFLNKYISFSIDNLKFDIFYLNCILIKMNKIIDH